RNTYYNEYNIKIVRIPNKYRTTINSKLKLYKNLNIVLEEESPDILFIHGVQFLDLINIVKYLNENSNVKVFVDNHADFSNSATNWFSKKILHKKLWKTMARKIEPYTTKFYGVLPARVDFLKEMYEIPEDKIELLVMGADDDKVESAKDPLVLKKIFEKYNIK